MEFFYQGMLNHEMLKVVLNKYLLGVGAAVLLFWVSAALFLYNTYQSAAPYVNGAYGGYAITLFILIFGSGFFTLLSGILILVLASLPRKHMRLARLAIVILGILNVGWFGFLVVGTYIG